MYHALGEGVSRGRRDRHLRRGDCTGLLPLAFGRRNAGPHRGCTRRRTARPAAAGTTGKGHFKLLLKVTLSSTEAGATTGPTSPTVAEQPGRLPPAPPGKATSSYY